MNIRFTTHAESKFSLLEEFGVSISRAQVEEVVKEPAKVEESRKNRKVAQAPLDDAHVLRVVYEESGDELVVVTFYPARRERYEDQL